jgi:hypothetical protein
MRASRSRSSSGPKRTDLKGEDVPRDYVARNTTVEEIDFYQIVCAGQTEAFLGLTASIKYNER